MHFPASFFDGGRQWIMDKWGFLFIDGVLCSRRHANPGAPHCPPPKTKNISKSRVDTYLKLPDTQQNWESGGKLPSTEPWLCWRPTSLVSMRTAIWWYELYKVFKQKAAKFVDEVTSPFNDKLEELPKPLAVHCILLQVILHLAHLLQSLLQVHCLQWQITELLQELVSPGSTSRDVISTALSLSFRSHL